MNRHSPVVRQWIEGHAKPDARCDVRAYYESAADTIAAMHDRAGPFTEARWRYLAVDLAQLRVAVERFCSGRILDLGCGAGHWLRHYAGRAEALTLVDLSAKLLARARGRLPDRVRSSTRTLALDIFGDFARVPAAQHDSILIAFVLSHYSTAEVLELLRHIRRNAPPGASLLVMDSWHSPARRRKRPREALRTLCIRDGVQYSVHKRYVTKREWAQTLRSCGLQAQWQWWGSAFFACHCVVPPRVP